MKIAINPGHTLKGAGYGAVSGKYRESEITRLVANELIIVLKKKGHTVYDATVDKAASQNAYLAESVKLAKDADLFLSIHCNMGGGNGIEAYTWKGSKVDKAVHLCYELSRLGFKNRGIKDGSNLYVIKHTKCQAVLLELFFMDNKADRALYDKLGSKSIAKAIAEAF